MAIYHLNVKIISRGKGKNAVSAAAYRRAAKLFDERLNRTWNYEHKVGVIHREIIIPDNAPRWACELVRSQKKSLSDANAASGYLWNVAEKTETRLNSRIAREVEFALPVELTQAQSIKLAQGFIQSEFVALGMVADMSVHWDNPDNPHVHVMLTTRRLVDSGFGAKDRAWDNKALLLTWRAKWAEEVNQVLRKYGHDSKIDHRSYKDQGIDLIPTSHRGHAVPEMERRGKAPDRGSASDTSENINNFDIQKIENHNLDLSRLPNIIKKIENHHSVFGEKEISEAIRPYTRSKTKIEEITRAILSREDVFHLGTKNGQDRYTTWRMFNIEYDILRHTEKLIALNKHNTSVNVDNSDITSS